MKIKTRDDEDGVKWVSDEIFNFLVVNLLWCGGVDLCCSLFFYW